MRNYSIESNKRSLNPKENMMKLIFKICATTAIIAVVLITAYMVISGAPAIAEVGIFNFLFGTKWAPTSNPPSFGIFSMIATSILGTLGALLLGVPIGILVAIYLAEFAPKPVAEILRFTVQLLAGIPSVIYGLIGMLLLVPQAAKLEAYLFAQSPNHIFTGGANLLVAIIILAIMILPTVISLSEVAIKSVPKEYKEASLGVGGTHMQTIFKVILPAAKSGIITSVLLGMGRAIGEAMAVLMVSGNVVNLPSLFASVRFLTTGIVSEMSYASGLHREALFGIGLILFVFIMIINIIVNVAVRKSGKENA